MSEIPMTRVGKMIFALIMISHATGMMIIVGCSEPSPPNAANCPGCIPPDWVGKEACGAGASLECQHGPENDPQCHALTQAWITANAGPLIGTYTKQQILNMAQTAVCAETNGGNGDCNCYDCGLGAGCEGFIEDYMSWCGNGEGKDGSCTTEIKNVSPAMVVRKEYKATIPDGGACSFSVGFIRAKKCGLPMADYTLCSCLGEDNNCVATLGTMHPVMGTFYIGCPTGSAD